MRSGNMGEGRAAERHSRFPISDFRLGDSAQGSVESGAPNFTSQISDFKLGVGGAVVVMGEVCIRFRSYRVKKFEWSVGHAVFDIGSFESGGPADFAAFQFSSLD